MKMRAFLLPAIIAAIAAGAWALGYLSFGTLPVTASDARVRLPAAPGVPGAGYFRLRGFESLEELTGISSPAAERIEMHLSAQEKGVSRMVKVDAVTLPRTGEFAFEPGGYHLMLFGLRGDLRPGGTIPLTLTFRQAPPLTVEARLEAPGGGMGGHGGH